MPGDTQQKTRYARFWKCALQVNPAGYIRYRGEDHGLSEQEYNIALRDACVENDVAVVGIADHGNVRSLKPLQKVLSDAGIVVLPGFEIASSEKAHLVCLFPEDSSQEWLNQTLGAVGIEGDSPGDEVRRSTNTAIQIVQEVDQRGGFSFAAHVTGDNGILKLALHHVWKCSLLRAVQIPGDPEDLRNERDHGYYDILSGRNEAYHRPRPPAVINASDVARPEDLARPQTTTLVKMTRPGLSGIKLAVLDPESRILLNSRTEKHYHSVIERIQITGGYLDGLDVYISDHLNTVIGGRGTGKSTLIEAIRFCMNREPRSTAAREIHNQIIGENLAVDRTQVRLTVRSRERQGRRFVITRRYGEAPVVRTDEGEVSPYSPHEILPRIDVFSQNEIADIARLPSTQRDFVAHLLPVDSEIIDEEIGELQRQLGVTAEKLLDARDRRDQLAEGRIQLQQLKEQEKELDDLGIRQVVARVPSIEREKTLIERIGAEFTRFLGAIQQLQDALPDPAFLSAKSLEHLHHRNEFSRIREEITTFKSTLERHQKEMSEETARVQKKVMIEVDLIRSAIDTEEAEIEKKFSSIPATQGRPGRELGRTYQNVLRQIEKLEAQLDGVTQLDKLVEELETERRRKLAELGDAASRRNSIVGKAVKKLNKKLRGRLRVSLLPEADRESLRNYLLACNLEGVGEKKLKWVVDDDTVTPKALVETIRRGADAIRESDWSVTPQTAQALTKLSERTLLELEGMILPDIPMIELNVAHAGPENYRPLQKLSVGQQCTALLHMLLLENDDPLIIDQPEDNLDNSFIAERIVADVRRTKNTRQYLFATHNANIPVFGDAEWIGVLTADAENAQIEPENQGSIDHAQIRVLAADLLEGGRDAFLRRGEKYGIGTEQ